MARMLRRAPSTINRELARNTNLGRICGSHVAQQSCHARRRAARPSPMLYVDSQAWGLGRALLDWKWSPQQIAGTLKRVFPNEPHRQVSIDQIYTLPPSPSRVLNCAANSSPVCARDVAPHAADP